MALPHSSRRLLAVASSARAVLWQCAAPMNQAAVTSATTATVAAAARTFTTVGAVGKIATTGAAGIGPSRRTFGSLVQRQLLEPTPRRLQRGRQSYRTTSDRRLESLEKEALREGADGKLLHIFLRTDFCCLCFELRCAGWG